MIRQLLSAVMIPMFQTRPENLPDAVLSSGHRGKRLTTVIDVVTECCHLTLKTPNLTELCQLLDQYPDELRGFAYEGAGVGLAALDLVMPWDTRTQELAKRAPAYRYAIYLGAGMALARVHCPPAKLLHRLDDEVYKWVVLDGYGFHEGLFRHSRYVEELQVPARWGLGAFALEVFDHGIGRSLWFSSGADIDTISWTIQEFPASRQPNLWAGIGLACAYTGGTDAAAVTELARRAGPHLDRLVEGAAIAALNRHEVGNTDSRNHMAVEILCGHAVPDVAAIAAQELTALAVTGSDVAYEHWRARIRDRLAPASGGVSS